MFLLRIFIVSSALVIYSQSKTDISLDPLIFDQNDGYIELADNGSGETTES